MKYLSNFIKIDDWYLDTFPWGPVSDPGSQRKFIQLIINTLLSININADSVVTLPAINGDKWKCILCAFDSAPHREARKKERKKMEDSHKQTYHGGWLGLRRVHTRVWAQFKYNRMTPVGMSTTPKRQGGSKVLFVREKPRRDKDLSSKRRANSRCTRGTTFSRRSSIDSMRGRLRLIGHLYTLASQPVFARSVKQLR